MKIGSRILLLSFLVVLLSAGFFLVGVKCVSAEGAVGVSQGQLLHYSLDCGAVGGNDTIVMNLSEFHGFHNITVVEVNGSLITFTWVRYNLTYSTEEFGRYEDVATGKSMEDYLYGYEPFFVAANLTSGDPVVNSPASMGYLIRVNETIMTSYLGFSRETNHVILQNKQDWETTVNNVSVIGNWTYQYFFDKPTGIPVRLVFDTQYSRTNGSDLLVTYQRFDYVLLSSVPPIPEFSSWIFVAFFCAVGLLSVAVSKNKYCRGFKDKARC